MPLLIAVANSQQDDRTSKAAHLPPDVLMDIFRSQLVIDPIVYSRVKRRIGWMVSAAVCSQWRETVISCGELWGTSFSAIPHHFHLFNKRANGFPLTLKNGHNTINNITDRERLLTLLQWFTQAGVVTLGGDMCDVLRRLYKEDLPSRISVMTLHHLPSSMTYKLLIGDTDTRVSLPSLRSLTLKNVMFNIATPRLTHLDISAFSLEVQFPLQTLYDIIKGTPHLVHATFHLVTPVADLPDVDDAVELHCMEDLTISAASKQADFIMGHVILPSTCNVTVSIGRSRGLLLNAVAALGAYSG